MRYVGTPQAIPAEDFTKLKESYSEYRDNPSALWHINNMLADLQRFTNSAITHDDSLPPAQKPGYRQAIGDFFRAVIRRMDPEGFKNWITPMEGSSRRNLIARFLPEYADLLQQIEIETNLEQWLVDSAHANKSLKTTAERQKHAGIVKELLKKYAPDNWQERAPVPVIAKFMQQIFKEEIRTAEIERTEAEKAKTAKLIGLLALGGFGVFFLTRLLPKR